MAVITAVPRLGSFRISPTGASTASVGGSRNSGRPTVSHDARWNQAASAMTSASFMYSLGCHCIPADIDPALRA